MNRLYHALLGESTNTYASMRLWFIRGLGFIYFIAFLIVFHQSAALWGRNGLLPIDPFAERVIQHFGRTDLAFWKLPSLFYFFSADSAMPIMGVLGMLGGALLMWGWANSLLLLTLWLLQMSFVNSGQLFYGYGWETLLLETTFLAIFLVPLWHGNLRASNFAPPRVALLGFRWLLFRLMFGAGLIKLRGDSCWWDLTCLVYHYETQPNPHPLSYFFHLMPVPFHKAGVLFNHFVELIVPFGFFGSRRWRHLAGGLTAIFQITLILSGNLAWLNWLTLIIAFTCFDDSFFQRLGLASTRIQEALVSSRERMARTLTYAVLALALLSLSVAPLLNLFRSNQAMNTSYDQWHIVNSYGAFGSVGKERNVVVISGSMDQLNWQEYEFPCYQGPETRRPCLITPYHYHLDWQMWFSSMRPRLGEEWLLRLAVRLLENDPSTTGLIAKNPFASQPPRFIKMDLYNFRFADWSVWPSRWWERKFLNPYMGPISLDRPEIQSYRSPR